MGFTIYNTAQSVEDPTGRYPQAEPDRYDFDILAAGISGASVLSGCAVTAQTVPDMTVAVAFGRLQATGKYAPVTVTAGNVTITAAHATLPRFDLITINNAGTKAATAGTAAAVPVFPAIPDGSVVVAAVYVPAAATTITTARIVDKRAFTPLPKRGAATVAVKRVTTWNLQASTVDNDWRSICWAPELGIFCAVSDTGTGDRVMTSPDGVKWTARVSAADNSWNGVAWSPELSLFAAVGYSGVGNRVMTSPDGITWTARASAADVNWNDICWSPELGLFASVTSTAGASQVQTSADGITWTLRTSASNLSWRGITWAPELGIFCATASTGTGTGVMTSPDGITWTTRVPAADLSWRGIAWSPELRLFAVVGQSGTGNRVMTSPDGVTWTSRTSAGDHTWNGIAWSPELGIFCAVSETAGVGNEIMTSPDGITWTLRTAPASQTWRGICWSPELGIFCSASRSGTGTRVMTSLPAIAPASKKTTVTAMTTSATITVAALRGGMITANQGGGAGATYTMPTGTVFDTTGGMAIGETLDFSITNISTNALEDVTVAGAAGMTAVGNLSIPSNDATTSISFGTFRIVKEAANTFSFYRVG